MKRLILLMLVSFIGGSSLFARPMSEADLTREIEARRRARQQQTQELQTQAPNPQQTYPTQVQDSQTQATAYSPQEQDSQTQATAYSPQAQDSQTQATASSPQAQDPQTQAPAYPQQTYPPQTQDPASAYSQQPQQVQSSVQRVAGKAYELLFLHTNDHHGTVLPNNGQGGLAERATLIKTARVLYPQVLLLDAGDINTGTALSNMFNAEPDLLAYNMMGYDAMTLGNHEFDGDLEKLQKQMEFAKFPFLSANIKKSNGEYFGTPYIVKNYDGFRVGIFGITTLRTKVIAKPDSSLVFIDEITASKEMVDILRNREKVDIVIALTHIGDIQEYTDHITSLKLASEVSGIDIIIDGHSHSYYDVAKRLGNTYIVTANEWGKYLGAGKLTIIDGKIANFLWLPIRVGPDPELAAALKPYIERADASLKDVIGTASETFIFGDRLTRRQETALGNIICDSNVWYFRTRLNQHVDFAFHNGGNIRTELPAGPITRERILTILPFENYIYIVSLKGSDVIELFNFIASIPQGAGGFAQVSSDVRYTIDYSSGTGVLKNLTINGEPVDPEKTYRFSTNDYLLGGGDGYTVLSRAQETFNTSLLLSYLFMEYIQSQGTISPRTDGRITITN